MTKYMREYVSRGFETWGSTGETVDLCDDKKAAEIEVFTHTNY